MKIMKVISGFQTGVDIAGVTAAKDAGLETGGYIPRGYRTLDGPKPQYKEMFNAIEHSSFSYKERTWDNVYSSDATLRFAYNYKSAGEKCTYNAIVNFGKPHLDITIEYCVINKCDKVLRYQCLKHSHDIGLYIQDWLSVNRVKVLNVAGNSESTCPGIYELVYEFLLDVFKDIKHAV